VVNTIKLLCTPPRSSGKIYFFTFGFFFGFTTFL
jgi:hypothetical protein